MFLPFFSRLHTCAMARSSSTEHWCFECSIAMLKLEAGPTPPLDALQAVSQRPPCLSFRLLWGAAANQSAVAICIKISRPPLERALSRRQPSSISTPQDARHHRVNTQYPPPTAAIFNHLAHSPPRCAYRSFHRAPKRPTSGFGQGRADRRVATPSSAGSTPSLPPGRTGDT